MFRILVEAVIKCEIEKNKTLSSILKYVQKHTYPCQCGKDSDLNLTSMKRQQHCC